MKKVYLMLAFLVQVSVVFGQTHFVKGYIGNGTDHMNIVIQSADIEGAQLEAGDEIAVFDGNLCCGAVLLTQTINPADALTHPEFVASGNDGTSNGFNGNSKMYFRFWDSSAGVEYHNVIPVVTGDGSGTFVVGGTAYVSASSSPGNTTKTFTGAFFGVWNWSSNWTPVGVPEPNSDVILPVLGPTNQPIIYPTDELFCGSLAFSGASTLTVQSDVTGTGSLVVANGITGTATVNISRHMSGGAWHLISSSLSGQSITDFLIANTSIPTNGASRGMMDYSESADDWSGFYTNATGGNVTVGKGYGIRTSGDAAVLTTGSLSIDDVNVSVTASNNGWNLLGNPYPSAIYARQDALGFLKVNETALDPSYTAIYLWDDGAGAYTIINSGGGQNNLASGQGFFVKASSGSVSFKQSMQVHDNALALKSGEINNPNLVLKAKSGNLNSIATINFDEGMTIGLDPSYDAGILRSGNGFDIYSKLVEDNGVDFAIQWLPGNSTDSYVIPIGVDAIEGGEIVFSAQTVDLPVGYEVMIEDRLTNSQTNIKNGGLYVANLADGAKGIGRFYLHVGSSVQTGLNEVQKDKVVVYTIDQTLFIKGSVSDNAQISIYSVDGRLVNRFAATSKNLNKMSVAGYAPGVYILNIQDRNNYKPVKFVVE